MRIMGMTESGFKWKSLLTSQNGIRQINTVKYVVQETPEYSVDIADVDKRIVQAAGQFNRKQSDTPPLYYVVRTGLGRMLPVYVSFKYDRAHPRTVIRRIDGSLAELAKEISSFVPEERIFIRPLNRTIRIRGNYGNPIKEFLSLRGF